MVNVNIGLIDNRYALNFKKKKKNYSSQRIIIIFIIMMLMMMMMMMVLVGRVVESSCLRFRDTGLTTH